MSDIHEHLEHAEHTAHGGHGSDPMMLQVAMTMAIIAAALALVSVTGHRKHNEVLQMQGNSNRLLSEAAALKVESSNTFGRFQSKKGRIEEQERAVAFTKLFTLASGTDELRAKYVKAWEDYGTANRTSPKDIKTDETGFPLKTTDGKEDDTLGALIVTGQRYQQLAEEKVAQSAHLNEAMEHVHHQADKLDWAHLTLEIGLVLCTISVLTRKKAFWMVGILSALAGGFLAFFALYLVH
jgi:hypothetical protein